MFKNKKSSRKRIARTVLESIPYDMVYPNGMIMVEPGLFSKSYKFDDANFSTESEEKQEELLKQYGQLLGKFPSNVTAQITIHNHKVEVPQVLRDIALRPKDDALNQYREEYNDILQEKILEGRNDIRKGRYFTISVRADDVVAANAAFATYDREVPESFSQMNRHGAEPITIGQRLEVLNDIYNPMGTPFQKRIADFKNDGLFQLPAMQKKGITSKELICPDGLVVGPQMVQMGELYAQSYVISELPTMLDTSFLSDLTNIPCRMLTSYLTRVLPAEAAKKMVKTQNTDIKAELVKKQMGASKGGYDPNLISDELSYAREEAAALMRDISVRNQKVFLTTLVITLFAESKEELGEYASVLKMKAADHACQARLLLGQQMLGINSSIPFGKSFLEIDRILTTESVVAITPFATQELLETGGRYYGLNQQSNNMIVYNRRDSDLPNGLILGKSGSGKSFIAKGEIIPNLLGTEDMILIIDPDREYRPIAEAMGGQVVPIANGSNTFINPLDMDMQYAASDNDDPVAVKCDYLVSLCETMVGKGIGLSPYEVNLIHKCGKAIYEPYLQVMEHKREGVTCDRAATPTLLDFYEELLSRPEPEAHRLAMCIELYCVGNYGLFAHRTNINPDARMIVYDIKDVPANIKDLAMQVCLNDIWNRVIENFGKGIRTWVYLDEFYLLLQTQSSAAFLQMLWKRIRKWKGIMTGITQDVEDCLVTQEGRAILSNSGFLLMMNQSPLGRAELQEQYAIPDGLIDYIKDKPTGTGLMYNGLTILPFDYKLPAGMLYKLMSTKPKDLEVAG